MVELILSKAKLARLKAAVTVGSEESAALGCSTGLALSCSLPNPLPSSADVRSQTDCSP
jgi:hypothetical protein